MNTDPAPSRSWMDWSWGVVLVLVGGTAVALAARLEYTPLGDNWGPGPRFFPMILGTTLLLGGLVELTSLGLRRRSVGPAKPGGAALASADTHPVSDLPGAREAAGSPSSWDALIVLAAVGVYVAALGWVGFSLSTVLLVVGLMLRLGARWLTAGVTAVALVVVVQLLFVQLFRVQLPTGTLGLPF